MHQENVWFKTRSMEQTGLAFVTLIQSIWIHLEELWPDRCMLYIQHDHSNQNDARPCTTSGSFGLFREETTSSFCKVPSSSLSTWRGQILSVPWQSWHRFVQIRGTVSQWDTEHPWTASISGFQLVGGGQPSVLNPLLPCTIPIGALKTGTVKTTGIRLSSRAAKQNKTPNSWIHLVNLGLWWELCRWDCSRWLYCPSIVIMFVTSPYISHSGNPFFSSGGWALWMHFGLPLNHNKLPWTHLVQQNGEKGTNHKGVQDVVSTVTAWHS